MLGSVTVAAGAARLWSPATMTADTRSYSEPSSCGGCWEQFTAQIGSQKMHGVGRRKPWPAHLMQLWTNPQMKEGGKEALLSLPRTGLDQLSRVGRGLMGLEAAGKPKEAAGKPINFTESGEKVERKR